MNDLLDEETLAVFTEPETKGADGNQSARLSSSNLLKNHARYSVTQQKGNLFDNSILEASASLLSLTVSIKRLQCPEDMYTFRQEIKNLLTDLKYRVAKLDYPPSIADKTCFLFAVMLDEQILHSEWGEESGWENQTIVSELFGIKNGGEQFYLVTERALLQPVLLRDFLELIYIMIKLGFRGRYRVEGKELLGILIQRLEEAVFAQPAADQEPGARELKPETELARKSRRPKRPVSPWRSLAFFVLLTGCAWGGVYYWYDVTSPQKAQAFINLPAFTEQFYTRENVQEQEYVYRSTPEEMEASVAAYGSAVTERASAWNVQLATFKTSSQAQGFVTEHIAAFPDAQVETWNGQFRVIVKANNKSLAQTLVKTANNSGINDAFIYSGKN